MLGMRLMGLCAVVPVTVLLTVSFFVLVVLRRVEEKGVKAFGYVVASLLWISALLVLSCGIYTLSTGRCPMMSCMKAGMMKHKMEMMQSREHMPPMMQDMECEGKDKK